MSARIGSAVWTGDLQGGAGKVTVGESAFEGEYSFASRFEEGEGTNPEELLAAAHAACFSMAFANILAGHGHAPTSITTTARAYLRNIDGKPTVARIELDTEGVVDDIDEAHFVEHAIEAKDGCPISRALNVPEVEVNAKLAG